MHVERTAVLAAALVIFLGACTTGPSASASVSALASAKASSQSASEPSAGLAGLPGKIAFTRFKGGFGWEGDFLGTYLIQADGSGELPLPTPNHANTFLPTWSPDGTRLSVQVFDDTAGIAGRTAIVSPDGSDFRVIKPASLPNFLSCTDWSSDARSLLCTYDDDARPELEGIYQVSVDGSQIKRLTHAPYPSVVGTAGECGGGDYGASYSPDGRRFAFIRLKCGVKADPSDDQTAEVWVGNTDGTGLSAITSPGVPNSHGPGVAWSPDGRSILFGDANGALRLVTPDGVGVSSIALGGPPGVATTPTWSPDGAYILFSLYGLATGTTDLYVAHADGSDVTRITTTPDSEEFASWGP